MIDGTNTTRDWQRHAGDIAVMGIGAFEQHAAHLPLDTDGLEADFLARMVAEELDAALLPSLRFATSLEHTGFRGTVSLRPETAMQVIRDIADEQERQAFRIWIIVNAHGGNFFLTSVCRDINRADRRLKILLFDPWACCDDDIARDSRELGTEIHAGECETSFMLAIAPDLVRMDLRKDRRPPTDDPHPLHQPDLTTFGAGHFNPDGAIGFPGFATAEKGRAMIASIRRNMPSLLRDRIARLRRQSRYSGSGGIEIRRMTPDDLPDAMRLKEIAGWNQTEADWRLFLDHYPEGCLAAVCNGRVVGTATAADYGGRLGWIGMVLVDPEFRRMGIGTRLLEAACERLAHCEGIQLDATPAGQPVYERRGFIEEWPLTRMVHAGVRAIDASNPVPSPLRMDDLDEAVMLDTRALGANREPVLRSLLERSPQVALQIRRNGRMTGFCLGRPGEQYSQIGPVMASSVEDAIELAHAAMAMIPGSPLVLDVPDATEEFAAWLLKIGFTAQRPLLRMRRGEFPSPDAKGMLHAIAGPELG